MTDLGGGDAGPTVGELAQENLQLHRQLRRLTTDHTTLRSVQTRQTVAFREVSQEQDNTVAVLRRALDELSTHHKQLVWQAEDHAKRCGRRVGLLALRGRTLEQLERLRAEKTRGVSALDDDVLPRRGPRRSVVTRWPGARRRLRSRISQSGLFSPDWYRQTYEDARGLGEPAALAHFVAVGLSEDRDPHPLFSAAWVRRQLPSDEVRPPLLAFLDGAEVQPHPLFDPEFYLASNRDVRESGENPLLHYVKFGAAERRHPHPAFDPHWYAAQRGETDAADLLSDYLETPDAFSLDPFPLFDAHHYMAQVPGLEARKIAPLLHYFTQGWAGGATPHPLFQTAYYLDCNRDVAAARINPFLHFLRQGSRERRQAHPLFDTWWYLEQNPEVAASEVNPLVHYVVKGAMEGRSPGPVFPHQAFVEAFPDFDRTVQEPIQVFLSGEGMRLEVPRRRMPDAADTAVESIGHDDRFWLTDRLREYVEARHGAEAVAPLHALMEIVARYGDSPFAFEASEDLKVLSERLGVLAEGLEDVTPDVSIIVPVHNALVFTLTSIVSVLASPSRYTFEVLVADDASTDLTEPTFAAFEGRVRLVRQPANFGFLENCNAAAAEARGRHLVFLNNDTIVLPGWLDELIDTFARDGTVGFVGSKLLNGDGSLQEAGGILWRDGSGWNYGRGDNPSLPEFNYLKDVDYCSGASIAIPTSLWKELGGFDSLYKPAYCEDSDLAFRVRAAGYRSVYQPMSELVHHEGRSHGRDVTGGIKAYQVQNQQKFFKRWSETLARENFSHGQDVLVARDRSLLKPHILIVDHYVPQWDRDAGSRTMYHFIRVFLARGFQVTFWPDNLHRDPVYTAPLQRIGVEVVYGPEYVDQFASWFSERSHLFAYALLSRPHIAVNYIDAVSASPGTRVVYYGHDLHWNRLMDQYAVTGNPEDLRHAERFRADEMRLARASAVVIYPSELERDLVRQSVEPETFVAAVPAWIFDEADLAAGVRRVQAAEEGDPFSLLFVGGFGHSPNTDGIRWFVSEVFPRLLEADERFRLTIVGSNAGSDIWALAGGGVTVAGALSDEELARHYEDTGVAIVPLRFGGGVKGKVIEAFSKGVPVVSTGVGLQGIPEPARLAFLADEPEVFAAAVLHAVTDRAAAAAKAKRALAFLRERYSAEALAATLAAAVPELQVAAPSPPPPDPTALTREPPET